MTDFQQTEHSDIDSDKKVLFSDFRDDSVALRAQEARGDDVVLRMQEARDDNVVLRAQEARDDDVVLRAQETCGDSVVLCAQEAGQRLDVFLAEQMESWTRSFAQNQIKQGRVLLNDAPGKANARVKAGDSVCVSLPPLRMTDVKPENIPIDIVYQDDDIAVINKRQGMVVHPAPGHESGTLVNALLYHIKDLAGIGGELRPGIVHRIDKDTSGLLLIAKNDRAHRDLAAQIKAKTARRVYWAIVHNNFKSADGENADVGVIDAPIGRSRNDRKKMAVTPDGRPAITHYKVLERFGAYSLVECSLETGRTHQIRVHMAHIGHPVLGDPVYSTGKNNALHYDAGQALHAYHLRVRHPVSNRDMEFFAPLPENFAACLDALRKRASH